MQKLGEKFGAGTGNVYVHLRKLSNPDLDPGLGYIVGRNCEKKPEFAPR